MLFSGTYHEKACSECGHRIVHTRTTAILFWIMLVGIMTAIVMPSVKSTFGDAWWHWPLTIVGELVLLIIIVAVICTTSNWLRRIPSKCPKCGNEMHKTASGFYDFSLIPTLDDILIAITFGLSQILIVGWIAK